jgi:hypothetical protein
VLPERAFYVVVVDGFDLETWALVNAIHSTPEDNARLLALMVTDEDVELPDRFDKLAHALAGAIHTHAGPEAADRFRKKHDWWKCQLMAGDWEDLGV